MDRQQLEQQADRIEALLKQSGVRAVITGGNVTPRWVQFLAQPAPGVKVDRVMAQCDALAQALGLPGHAVRVSQQNGIVRIDVPRDQPQSIRLSRLIARLPRERLPEVTAVLGLADDGAPLLINLRGEQSQHVLCSDAGPVTTLIASLIELHTARSLHLPAARSVPLVLPVDFTRKIRPVVLESGAAIRKAADVVVQRQRDGATLPNVIVVINLDELGGGDQQALAVVLHDGSSQRVHVLGVGRGESWPVVITSTGSETYTARHRDETVTFDLAVVDTPQHHELNTCGQSDRAVVRLDPFSHGAV